MSSRLRTALQYLVILSVTALLVWFSLRGLDSGTENSGAYLARVWREADKGWLILMAAISIASHLVRALRWRLLMIPSGHTTRLSHCFYSLMVGYLVNLVIPRGGELSRCYNLYKLDRTPVETSFGTVVTERIVDVICLAALIALSFALESDKLLAFIETLPIDTAGGSSKIYILVAALLALLILASAAWLILRRQPRFKAFFSRTLTGFRHGLMSIFSLREKRTFIFYSLLIWVFYFVMSYAVIRAFPSTSTLGVDAVLSLFAIGAIAMAVPLPGGAGSYHVLVPQGLVFLYNLPRTDAIAFTFIFHGWQTVVMIVTGALSLIITSALVRRQREA